MSKQDKLIALINDQAATAGERQAASRALQRMTETAIEPTSGVRSETITLVSVWMRVPNLDCIYAPSRFARPETRPASELLTCDMDTILVSFDPDGKSNPVEMTCYGQYIVLEQVPR